ncbi:MAG: cysteine desulfurase [Clostridia bacterium]|nr:cysteine desulfurase [Clostridia bacterium]
MREIYLDNSATTKVIPEAVEAMLEACQIKYGNPSSLHGKGIEAEKIIRETRERIAGFLNCSSKEIFFTSGGTEANNWAVFKAAEKLKRFGKHIITTSIEHSSVLEPIKELEGRGFEVTYLSPSKEGIISLEELKRELRPDTILVSIMHANNETGALQPVFEAAEIIKNISHRAFFHVDAVQSFGKVNIDLKKERGIDFLSISAHKIHGPKGIGALFIREGLNISPFLLGGEQEGKMRAGTENLPGIAGFGAALKGLENNVEAHWEKIKELKERFVRGIKDGIRDVIINGPLDNRALPHIVNVSFPGVKGEVLVHFLEQWGIYISTGSACHSRGGSVSHVLKAMGLKREALEGAVRVSFSALNSQEEVDFAVEKFREAVEELRSL